MNRLKRRVESLETKLGPGALPFDSLILHFVAPGPNGPVDSGYATAMIYVGPNKGMRLHREEGETQEEFKARVEALECETFGKPELAA